MNADARAELDPLVDELERACIGFEAVSLETPADGSRTAIAAARERVRIARAALYAWIERYVCHEVGEAFVLGTNVGLEAAGPRTT